MPKLKTHKGAAKRFKVTRTGKVLRMKGHSSHLRRRKRPSTKRLYPRKLNASPADAKGIKKLLRA